MLLFISMHTEEKLVLGVLIGIMFLSGIMFYNYSNSNNDEREIVYNVLHEPLNLIQATEAGIMTSSFQQRNMDEHYIIIKENEVDR